MKLVRPFIKIFHTVLDIGFCHGVYRTGGFIHDKYVRSTEHCPGKADQLFLTYRKQVSPFSHIFFITLIQGLDEAMSSSESGCLFNFCRRGLQISVEYVFPDGTGKKVRGLQDNTDPRLQGMQADFSVISAVD